MSLNPDRYGTNHTTPLHIPTSLLFATKEASNTDDAYERDGSIVETLLHLSGKDRKKKDGEEETKDKDKKEKKKREKEGKKEGKKTDQGKKKDHQKAKGSAPAAAKAK